MKRLLLAASAVCALSCQGENESASLNADAPKTGSVRAAYYPEWGVYGRQYPIDAVPFDKISHLLYAFLPICGPNESLKASPEVYAALERECAGKQRFEVTIHDTWAALNPPHDTYKKLAAKKAQYPHVKILASVGGWTLSDPFYEMASHAANRKVFIDSVLRFLDQYRFFDGVDLDWEYPGGGGANTNLGSPADKANYLALMKELRQALDSRGRGYLLTSAVGAAHEKIQSVDYKALFAGEKPIMDMIFAMTYDYYGAWNGERGHMAGVYPGADLVHGYSAQETVDNLIHSGVPANRLAIGVASYGRAWQNIRPEHSSGLSKDAGDTSGEAFAMESGMWEAGSIDYKLIQSKYLKDGNFRYYYDQYSQAPFLYSPSRKVLISYDNKCSVQAKMDFAANRGLAGSFMWSLDSDNGDLLAVMNGQRPSAAECPCAKPSIPKSSPTIGKAAPAPAPARDVPLGAGPCFAGFKG